MSILDKFPFETFRKHQKETILRANAAFASGKKFVILDVPTGGGKSAIGVTFASSAASTYILTPQKILQAQYMKDFWDLMVELKGRNAYKCTRAKNDKKIKTEIYCNRGLCRQMGLTSLEECLEGDKTTSCEYFSALFAAQAADITLFNFKSFLCQTFFASQFPPRKLLIVDEAHNIESEIMDFVSISLSDKDFAEDGIIFPGLSSPEENLKYFQETINLKSLILSKIIDAGAINDMDLKEKWEGMKSKYDFFVECINKCRFVSELKTIERKYGEPYREITIKPLFVNYHANELLFSYADKVLLMSATILNKNVFCENLGIDIDDVEYISMSSTFPVKNRFIYKDYAGNMVFREKEKTLPKLVKKIEKIMDVHKNDRGIIHTHSFGITKYILENIGQQFAQRLLFQENFENKDLMLEEHKKTDNSVVIAPAMHEGLDLMDDLSRFQVLCKVPYPNIYESKQLAERVKLSWKYYMWLTCLKLVQSYGRSIRSETDYADTYILDAQFEKFINQAKWLLPEYFTEAILSISSEVYSERKLAY